MKELEELMHASGQILPKPIYSNDSIESAICEVASAMTSMRRALVI